MSREILHRADDLATGGRRAEAGILDSIPIPLFLVDRDEVVVFGNRGAQQFHDWEQGWAMGRRLDELILPMAEAAPQEGGALFPGARHALMRHKSGEEVEILFVEANLPTPDGTEERMVLFQLAPQPTPKAAELRTWRKKLAGKREKPHVTFCAWTKQLTLDSKRWYSIEKFFERYLHIKVTHGMTPEAERQMAASARENDRPV